MRQIYTMQVCTFSFIKLPVMLNKISCNEVVNENREATLFPFGR